VLRPHPATSGVAVAGASPWERRRGRGGASGGGSGSGGTSGGRAATVSVRAVGGMGEDREEMRPTMWTQNRKPRYIFVGLAPE